MVGIDGILNLIFDLGMQKIIRQRVVSQYKPSECTMAK